MSSPGLTKTLAAFSLAALCCAPAAAQERSRIVPFDDWDLKPQLEDLDRSLGSFSGLMRTLERANSDLARDFRDFEARPGDALRASKVELTLARYAAGLYGEFRVVEAEQDVVLSQMRRLDHRLSGMVAAVSERAEGFRQQALSARREEVALHNELIERARAIKALGPDEAEARATLTRAFDQMRRRYNLQRRAARGYAGRLVAVRKLRDVVARLDEVFDGLRLGFEVLVENLGQEREYLREAMELQRDGLEMQRFVDENLRGGEGAALQVAERLQQLYGRVDAFTQVHDRIQAGLEVSSDGGSRWQEMFERIEGIGSLASGSAQLDALIDSFADKSELELDSDEALDALLAGD